MQSSPKNTFSSYNIFHGFLLWNLVFLFSLQVFAEKLPLKFYSSRDGLVSDYVSKIVADSHGFLWFCTAEGLSRFDGYSFKNYTQEDGLPHREVYDLLETKEGDYLIATPKGLVIFNPKGKPYRWNIIDDKLEQNSSEPPLFKTYLPPDIPNLAGSKNIFSLAQDGNGNIYVTAKFGLYRLIKTENDWQFQRFVIQQLETNKLAEYGALFTDSRGDVWLGVANFVYLILKNGEAQKIDEPGSNGFFEDKDGNIWVNPGGHTLGLRVFSIENNQPVLKSLYTQKDGLLSSGFVIPIVQDSKRGIFINSNGKLLKFIPEAKENELKFRPIELENVGSAVNKDGTIWFATGGNGAARYASNSFYTFDEKDGLPNEPISWIFGNKTGEIFLSAGHQKLVRVKDEKIETVQLSNIKEKYWTNNFWDLQSQDGEFWLSSTNGLYRYPKISNFSDLNKTTPKKVYTTADGLFSDSVIALFEDSRGDIWMSSLTAENSLIRWEKSTEKIYRYTFDYGLPKGSGAITFGEDAAGNIWIAFFYGQIFRFKDGKFRSFTDEGLIQPNSVVNFLSDKQGRFWLATSSRGLFYVDDPNSENPVFTNFSTANGLSSNQTTCLLNDKFGSIYVTTGRGITRIEPDLKHIKIFTQNDGLPRNITLNCYADVNGNLWFSSIKSLIKYTPEDETPSSSPPIFIGGISVNGKLQMVSELGEKEVKNLEFDSDERQIQLRFFAISFDAGENLRYQYKINDQEWSQPSDRRTVDFNLSPGTHNFAVRAITANGVISEKPATISLTIARPVWQRWWFIGGTILLAGLAVFALDRYRVHKTHQVEKALIQSKESEIRFRTLADTASDAILTIDADSNIIFVNEAIEKVFGYTAQELIGKQMSILMPERMRDGHNSGMTRYLQTNQKNINWEGVSLPGLHKDGHEIPLEVSFGEFEREGKRYFTGIARDVSERKRAEEALQKAREEKIKELQRVRTRIATDLHDDIGSSLTQISVLSGVSRREVLENKEVSIAPLEKISIVSNELVESMSDIVWAINPRKDSLKELIFRMRRFASDILTVSEIEFEFDSPDPETEIRLDANIRREVFVIFKECLNNIVRHSGARNVEIVFQVQESEILIKITDDGKGFEMEKVLSDGFSPEKGGNGLINMRRRAKDLGGVCEFESSATGTIIKLIIPFAPSVESVSH